MAATSRLQRGRRRSISLERLFARLAEMTLLGRRLLHPLRRSAGMSSSSALAAEAAPPSALRWAVLPWSFFIGENVLLSHNRASIIALCGGDEQSYHALYNALSTAACASLGFGYFFRVAGAPPLRHVSVAAVGGSFVLQAVGLAGLFQALPRVQLPLASEPAHGERAEPAAASEAGAAARQWVIRCPMDFKGESASPAVTSPDGLHGLHRVSRHPMLWSLAAVGLGAARSSPLVAGRSRAPTAPLLPFPPPPQAARWPSPRRRRRCGCSALPRWRCSAERTSTTATAAAREAR